MKVKPCRHTGCRAQIIFAYTARGRRMPVDSQPFPRDDVRREGRWILHGERVVRDERIDTDPFVYVSHFATCPSIVVGRELERQRVSEPALAARVDSYRWPR